MLSEPWSSPGAALGFWGSRGLWLGEGVMSCSPLPALHPGNFPLQPGSGHLLSFYQQRGLEAESPAKLLREGRGCQRFLL